MVLFLARAYLKRSMSSEKKPEVTSAAASASKLGINYDEMSVDDAVRLVGAVRSGLKQERVQIHLDLQRVGRSLSLSGLRVMTSWSS
jgi:hypothetical protein